MKSKTIQAMIVAIVFIVMVVVWKLNSYYKQEKSAFVEGQIHQQSITLKTSVSSQLTQLKNIISSYQGQIDESKINWIQLDPFFALAQVEVNASGTYAVKNLFVKSGTSADNWSKDYLQKAFAYSPFSKKEIHSLLFQSQAGEKYLSLIFSEKMIQNSHQAVVLVGEATYFQKYFDTVRSAKSTNLLLTSDDVVAGHTQSEYIATRSQESKLSSAKYFMDRDELRSTNLVVMSYAPKQAKNEFLAIPLFVIIFVFGFAFLVVGILLYVLKPIENGQRKVDIFKKVFDEVKNSNPTEAQPMILPPSQVMPQPAYKFDLQAAPPKKIPLQEKIEMEIVAADKAAESSLYKPAIQNKTSLSEVVDQALLNLSDTIKAHHIKIDKQYDSETNYEIDKDRFRKAIENILLNAIEAQSENIKIKIYNELEEIHQPMNIDIIDDGQGLEVGTEDRIWQPFFGTKDKLTHKGLGLSEALSVIRRYEGELRLFANKSGGVTARIEMDAQSRKSDTSTTLFTTEESTTEIDIDSILNLNDDEEVEIASVDLEKVFKTTQFKMDEKVEIISQPDIKLETSVKPIDGYAVKVRKPGRT